MKLIEINPVTKAEVHWIYEKEKSFYQWCYDSNNIKAEAKKDLKLVLDNWDKGVAYKLKEV